MKVNREEKKCIQNFSTETSWKAATWKAKKTDLSRRQVIRRKVDGTASRSYTMAITLKSKGKDN
jgi:hypothetical protein